MRTHNTRRAQDALAIAREMATAHGRERIGTPHVLLGILGAGEGIAVTVLKDMGVDLQLLDRALRSAPLEEPGETESGREFTSHAIEAMRLAAVESPTMGHRFVGTEHLLLGLIGEKSGAAAITLAAFDVDRDKVLEQMKVMAARCRAEALEAEISRPATIGDLIAGMIVDAAREEPPKP